MSDPQSAPPPATPSEPNGFSGLFQDPSTLAATGLIAAVLFAVFAGFINVLVDLGPGVTIQDRMLLFTETVDVGDVALLGISVALLLLTPDPPGGIERPLLLRADAVLAGLIALFGVIRSIAILTQEGLIMGRIANVIATLGVALGAATVAFYAAKESFLKQEGKI